MVPSPCNNSNKTFLRRDTRMTQTVNGQKNTSAKQNRPGQRQQERLQRQARRQRRQRIWTSVVVAVVVVVAAGLGFWQYQRYTTQLSTASAARTASAASTASAVRTASTASAASAASKTIALVGPNCSTASSTPAIYASTPAAGPKNPPVVTGAPTTNADGLQCLDLKVGSGKAAQQGSTVSVEYTGWLASNGNKFDSSYDRKAQPFSVTPLGQAQVIQGWNEGLVGMKPGGIRRIILPASLGYGAQGNQAIPANATLIFDVTVLSVQ
jgi:FKBP-type peptidyl-prolyl cis-trans isomerase